MLTNADVSNDTMQKFGTFGLISLQTFRHIATDEPALRALLKKSPFDLDDTNPAGALEVAKVCSVWETAIQTIAVENRHKAERLHQDLPPRVNSGEMDSLKKVFEASEHKLNPVESRRTRSSSARSTSWSPSLWPSR